MDTTRVDARPNGACWTNIVTVLFLVSFLGLFAQTQPQPDLSSLSPDDRASIQSACSHEKFNLGPAVYHQCLQKQLSAMSGSQYPDLSSLSPDDRASIQSACSHEKFNLGPAVYHQCVTKQLRELRIATEPGPSPGNQKPAGLLPPARSTFPAQQILGPQHKRLAYFVGSWILAGERRASLFGPGGKFTGTQYNEWMSDGLSLASHWTEQSASGSESGHAVYRYDPDQKVFTYQGTTSTGETEASVGTVEGDTWIWISKPILSNGETVRTRFAVKELSPTSYIQFQI
jgi:hypothetical protein